ncbi:restriction endonuclease subunit S [Alishewanella sp. BS5-314]|nr:restriction endonuclease subunit S [Alishewanella sp. BS5-314]
MRKSSLEKRALEIGDILIEISGGGPDQPVGRTVLIDECAIDINKDYPKVCTNFIRLARPFSSVSSSYLNYYLHSFYLSGEVTKYQGGSNNLRNLKFKEYNQIKVPLAPLNEQKRIADKLDSILAKVDRAQARLEKIPGVLKRFRQSVLAAATSGELTREWRGGADHNWPTVALADVGKGFNYGSSAKSQPEGDIPVLRMGNLQGGQLDWGDLVYTSDKAEIEKYLLENGDVLFNRTNSPELVGKTSIYRGERKAIYAGYLIRVKGSERLNTEFLNIQLNSPHARDYCWQVKTDGVSQSNINAKKLQAYEFDLPAIDEQLEIVRRVSELFSHAALFERQYLDAKRRFDRLTQTVLAKAFRGELVEQNAADEPADKLLERIKQQQLDTPKSVKKPRNTSKRAKNPAVHSAEPSAELDQPQSDILSLLKNSKGELTVQQIIDQLSEKTFEQVDALFTELKQLLDSNLIIKIGAGEACAFKAVKR